MKPTIHYLFFFLFLPAYLPALSQFAAGYHQLIRSSWQLDKRQMIGDLMQFTAPEASGFWPVYDRHMDKWGRVMDYRINMAQQYCNHFPDMTGPKVAQYIVQLVSNDVELTRLQKKLFKKINKVLSPARSGQFMELEYKFQLALQGEIQQRTPFIGDNLKRL
jgi:hypothetical protein